jgi:hypothetical protein
MRSEFIKHFQDNSSCTTSIDDLDKCVQQSKETNRKWLRLWQDTWVWSSGVHPTLAVNTFKCCCRYEPLVVKIKRVLTKSTTDLSQPELIEITWCYAQENPMLDSDDESTMRSNPSCGGPLDKTVMAKICVTATPATLRSALAPPTSSPTPVKPARVIPKFSTATEEATMMAT